MFYADLNQFKLGKTDIYDERGTILKASNDATNCRRF